MNNVLNICCCYKQQNMVLCLFNVQIFRFTAEKKHKNTQHLVWQISGASIMHHWLAPYLLQLWLHKVSKQQTITYQHIIFSCKSDSTFTNVCSSVSLSSKPLNSLKSSSFILHHLSFILHHSSFILSSFCNF